MRYSSAKQNRKDKQERIQSMNTSKLASNLF
ncbi:unnamed protein product [Larinioides sclopetarius]|uniref:Uncharacterized protein n=1 Tax=Larinioides sclopetarius TaxID=280406 RepID=A0AAV1ZA97_9ARAC